MSFWSNWLWLLPLAWDSCSHPPICCKPSLPPKPKDYHSNQPESRDGCTNCSLNPLFLTGYWSPVGAKFRRKPSTLSHTGSTGLLKAALWVPTVVGSFLGGIFSLSWLFIPSIGMSISDKLHYVYLGHAKVTSCPCIWHRLERMFLGPI